MSEARHRSPWVLRVLLEGVVIVVSILLALTADAWWEGRQDRAEEGELLAGLRSEFLGIEQDLLRYEDYYRFVGDDVAALLAVDGPSPRDIRLTQADSAFRSLVFTPSYEPGEATLDGLVASGRLEQLQSKDLRDALNVWRNSLDEISDGQVGAADFVRSTVVPYLARAGAPMLRVYPAYRALPAEATDYRVGFESLVSEAQALAIYNRIRADPEFRALAGWRLREARGTTREVLEARVVVEEVLRLLE